MRRMTIDFAVGLFDWLVGHSVSQSHERTDELENEKLTVTPS